MGLNDKKVKWRVKIESISAWLAIGMCAKELVISNKFKFYAKNNHFNHGCFLLSSNGYSWNANVEDENNEKINGLSFIVDDTIDISYDPSNEILEFRVNDSKVFKLSEATSPKNITLVPAVVFLGINDSISLELINNN